MQLSIRTFQPVSALVVAWAHQLNFPLLDPSALSGVSFAQHIGNSPQVQLRMSSIMLRHAHVSHHWTALLNYVRGILVFPLQVSKQRHKATHCHLLSLSVYVACSRACLFLSTESRWTKVSIQLAKHCKHVIPLCKLSQQEPQPGSASGSA